MTVFRIRTFKKSMENLILVFLGKCWVYSLQGVRTSNFNMGCKSFICRKVYLKINILAFVTFLLETT